MSELKRYDFESDYDMASVVRHESKNGDYVEYSDAQAALAERDARIEKLLKRLDDATIIDGQQADLHYRVAMHNGELVKQLAEKDKEIERLRKVGEEDSYRYGFAVADIQRLTEGSKENYACYEVEAEKVKALTADNQRLREALERICREPHATTLAGMIDAFDKVIQIALAATAQGGKGE